MSHNFLLDLYAFLDDQMIANHNRSEASQDTNDRAWIDGRQSAWMDLRCFIDTNFYVKLPKRIQRKLTADHPDSSKQCRATGT